MIKKLFILCILPTLFINAFAQQGNQNDPLASPEIVKPTPEAASFAKYGNIPVGEYTGIPNISIPLHLIKAGNIEVPIELSYHASGITVGQEATWVGLGWNLIAGGSITYQPVGGNDQTVPNIIVPWKDKQAIMNQVLEHNNIDDGLGGWYLIPYNIMQFCRPASLQDQPYDTISPLAVTNAKVGRGEPDIFSVNFLSYSFKFILDPKDGITPIFSGKKNKCKIELIPPSGFSSCLNIPLINIGFKIIDERGIQYYFTAIETDYYNKVAQNWNLTSIVSPTGQSIQFFYNYGGIKTIPPISERMTLNLHVDGLQIRRNTSILYPGNNNCYLKKIVSANETVWFDVDSSRNDLIGAKRLLQIRFVNNFSNEQKLKFVFNYNYFIGCPIGGDYVNDDFFTNRSISTVASFSQDNISKRLKLLNLTRVDSLNNKSEIYSFGYDATPLPYKTSFASDFWGYYNGQENNSTLKPNGGTHTLLPNILPLTLTGYSFKTIPQDFWDINGACRGASNKYITAGMLDTIIYPTGGKTVFEFEPHSFGNYKYLAAEDEKTVFRTRDSSVYDATVDGKCTLLKLITLVDSTYIHFSGTINNRTTDIYGVTTNYSFAQLANASVFLHPVDPNDNISQSITCQLNPLTDQTTFANGGMTWNKIVKFGPGKYLLGCNDGIGYIGTAPLVEGYIQYNYIDSSKLSQIKPIGGGVRVKSISNYDTNNTLINSKVYNYVLENGYSSGKLLCPLENFRFLEASQIGNCKSNGDNVVICNPIVYYLNYFLSGDSYIHSAGSYVGTNVGYDRVEITESLSSKTNGKEIDYFQNGIPYLLYPDVPIFSVCTNGEQLSRVYLNSSLDTIQLEKNHFNQIDISRQLLNYSILDRHYGPEDCNQWGSLQNRYIITAYSNENFFNYLASQSKTEYLNGRKITKTTNYTYNLNNYCIQQISEKTSDNHVKYSLLEYPIDFMANNWVYSFMANNNIITPIIRKTDYIDNYLHQKISKTNYGLFPVKTSNGISALPDSIETSENGSSMELRIIFDSYDKNGNLVQFHKNNNINISYFWGYNQSFPVVKGENIDSLTLNSSVRSALHLYGFTTWEDFLKSIPSFPNANYSSLNKTIRSSCPPNSLITTYTYDPIFGMTSSTDPNGVSTYYEYDLFGRLKLVRDKDGKILKQEQYHYQNQ